MGYADTLPYQQVSIKSPLEVAMLMIGDGGVADYALGTVTIPSFRRPISVAYLDVTIQYCSNDNVASNYLINTGSFGLIDSGATYRSSANIAGGTLYTNGAEHWNAPYTITGANDLSSYITPGATHDIELHQVRCNAGNLYLYGYYAELRLYFNL